MKLKDKAIWKEGLQNNQDDYGVCGYRYAERWADMMEEKIEAGENLEDIAEQTSHDADTEGITGFMYGCAVSVLSFVWEYGEELRCWHNLDIQIKDEGEEANKKGSVLNPALLNISEKEGK